MVSHVSLSDKDHTETPHVRNKRHFKHYEECLASPSDSHSRLLNQRPQFQIYCCFDILQYIHKTLHNTLLF